MLVVIHYDINHWFIWKHIFIQCVFTEDELMFQGELYISNFQNIFAEIPYACLWFPRFSPALLASGSIQIQSPHIQVEENPEEIPFLISVV